MRKPDVCLCKNKGAGQLCSNCTADQRLCVHNTVSKIHLLSNPKFQLLSIFCSCTDRFVSDLVGNPEDQFSRVAAHIFDPVHEKTNNLGSHQARHKPGCTVTEDG